MRTDTLQRIREERTNDGQQGKFIAWREVHTRIAKWKEETGYSSDEEERKYREKKGAAADRKGQHKANGKGKAGKKGKGKDGAIADASNERRSY